MSDGQDMSGEPESRATPRMTTFVLVHGEWGGGWIWKQVASLLRAADRDVYTPTLTGVGERVHLRHAGITLDTHIDDIVNVLTYEDLHQAVLVAQAGGGAVITGVAERVPERLAHLVYVDACVLADGQSIASICPPEFWTMLEDLARTQGEGWRIPFPWPDQRPRTDTLLNVMTQPLRVNNPRARTLARTYIYCGQELFEPAAHGARTDEGWRYRELPMDHPWWTMPRELSALLLELA